MISVSSTEDVNLQLLNINACCLNHKVKADVLHHIKQIGITLQVCGS